MVMKRIINPNTELTFQKLHEALADPEFRELLQLEFVECNGDFEQFYISISECLGNQSKKFMDILYLIGSKMEFHSFNSEENNT